ncbi:protein of unknown function [Candidatus Methylocalor cossyra]|uniref:Uncharacterized protein n=1 Tax=Candidatus Methylocalor cossyra TaxID=3108543 RepID=A0ABP1C5B1_9GAMM
MALGRKIWLTDAALPKEFSDGILHRKGGWHTLRLVLLGRYHPWDETADRAGNSIPAHPCSPGKRRPPRQFFSGMEVRWG